jgi:MFS family permease
MTAPNSPQPAHQPSTRQASAAATAESPTTPLGLGAFGLTVLLAGQLLPMIDFSIVNVALDAIAHSLRASETDLELMVAVYGVAFAVCLAMSGRLGDNFGRRRLFTWGVALFAVASLGCGLAGSIDMLLAARVLQGVAAAMIVPQILATLHVALHGQAHARAIGLYGSISGIAFVIGQVLGGALVSANIGGWGWRSVFLVNLPICLLILAVAWRTVPETRAPRHAQLDLPGTGLLVLFLVCLLLPLAVGPSLHWPPYCFALLVGAALSLLALARTELWQERRGVQPLLPPALLRLGSVRFALLQAVLFFSCWSGFMFVVALTLQSGAGLSPLQSGNTFIALGTGFFASSLMSTRLVARLGRLPTLLLGCAIQMVGLLGVAWTLWAVWPHPNALKLIPASVLVGLGQALIVSCFFRIGLSDIPHAQAGAGSSMLSTVQQASFGLGTAVLGAVFAQSLGLGWGHLHAVLTALAVEFLLMAVLAACTWRYLRMTSAPADKRLAAAT